MTDDPPNPVYVPDTVYSQLEALREMGTHNMFTEVHAGLEAYEFDEALDWVRANTHAYIDGFKRRGFAPESERDEEAEA